MPMDITLNAKTYRTIAVNFNNRTAGYDQIDVQYSTRPDFLFVPSPLYTIASASPSTLQYFNQDNLYFIRARERRSSDNALLPWSNTLRVYTPVNVARTTTPASLMVTPAIIVPPEPVTVTIASAQAG